MFRLDEKKALITGATGGIGAAIAKVLHNQGALVMALGTNDTKLTELCAQLNHVRVHKMVFDLAQTSKIQALVDEVIETMKGIDILVCCAGVTKDALAIRMLEDNFDYVLNINLKASFMLNKFVLKHMIKHHFGRIINISSVVGYTGNPGQANYCASKAGLVGMSKALAREVASRGITVNCIAPGFIDTPMTSSLTLEQQKSIIASIPTGAIGSPLDIAYAAAYLASDEARYVTGSTLHVNGGLYMH